MTKISIKKLKMAVIDEFNSRHLASKTRYNALSNVVSYINAKYKGDTSCLSKDKADFKNEYKEYNDGTLSGAANGAINELYKQFEKLNSGNVPEANIANKGSLSFDKAFKKSSRSRENSDEYYVIRLCNKVLGQTALQQHHFPFLKGDTGRPLPVDAYYPDLNLVVEYREYQHTGDVPLFDNKMTVSGVNRKEQRARYDQRRRDELPSHGVDLVEISYSDFGTTKKLLRDEDHDTQVVKKFLAKYIK